jgi:hypothetical protein
MLIATRVTYLCTWGGIQVESWLMPTRSSMTDMILRCACRLDRHRFPTLPLAELILPHRCIGICTLSWSNRHSKECGNVGQ